MDPHVALDGQAVPTVLNYVKKASERPDGLRAARKRPPQPTYSAKTAYRKRLYPRSRIHSLESGVDKVERGPVPAVLIALAFSAFTVLFLIQDAGPHVSISTPKAGATVSGTVAIGGEASSDSQLTGVKVRVDAGDWWIANDTSVNKTWGTWRMLWDSTSATDGSHAITVRAWTSDEAQEATTRVIVANPPWVRILTPANRTTAAGNVTVVGEAGDPSAGGAVQLVQVAIDPTPNSANWLDATPTTSDWGQWSFDWHTVGANTGQHVVAARAFDGDLYSRPWLNEYFVDNRPFVHLVQPSGNVTPPETVRGILLVHGTAGSPADAGRVQLVQVRIDDGAWSNATDTSPDKSWTSWAYQWDTTAYADANHVVCVRAWDGSQYSEIVCAAVYVGNSSGPPTLSIVEPTDGETVRGFVLINGRASNDYGLVWLVQVSIAGGPWNSATDTSPDASWTTWASAWDTTARNDGCLYLSARAWSGSMFSDPATITACVDNRNDRPAIAFENLTNGDTVQGLYLVHGSTGITPGVQLVQVQIDNGAWSSATDTGPALAWSTWAFEWNTLVVPNGEHKVCARSLDGSLYSEPACVTVQVLNGVTINADSSTPEALEASVMALGLPGWVNSMIIVSLHSSKYAPLLIILVPVSLIWLRTHGYFRK